MCHGLCNIFTHMFVSLPACPSHFRCLWPVKFIFQDSSHVSLLLWRLLRPVFLDHPLCVCVCVCVCCSVVSNSLWPHGQYSPWGSSVHRILQARIPEWVAIPFSSRSSQPRDRTWVSCIAGRFCTIWATREAQMINSASNTISEFHRIKWINADEDLRPKAKPGKQWALSKH